MANTKMISNNFKKSLEAKLKEINTTLRDIYSQESNIGVLEGLSGIALFQFYYAKYTDNDEYANWGEESLFRVIELINNGYSFPTLSTGLAGAGWVFDHLSNEGFIEIDNDDLLSNIDDYLFIVMEDKINKGDYDFLHGAMGYAFYFFERLKNTTNNTLKEKYTNNIKYFLKELTEVAKEDSDGIKWASNIKFGDTTIEAYNLSLSHGMSSIISFLSEIASHNTFKNHCLKLLDKATIYILSKQLPENIDSTSLFPSYVTDNNIANIDKDSRLAWCYGDLGIGLACLKASKVLENAILEKKSLSILEHTTNRTCNENTKVIDAAICHGAFGNAKIYTFLNNSTSNNIYKESATFWMQEGMNMSTYDDGYAGFKQWFKTIDGYKPQSSLLEGIAGIGLSIIDYLSETPNKWDKCLLIS